MYDKKNRSAQNVTDVSFFVVLWLFSLILQGLHKEENADSWNSGLEKEQILETYSAQLQKSRNSTEHLIINDEKSSPKMKTRGATPFSRGCGAPPLGCAPYLMGPLETL